MNQSKDNQEDTKAEEPRPREESPPVVGPESGEIPQPTPPKPQNHDANQQRRWTKDPATFWVSLAGVVVVAIYTFFAYQQVQETQEANAISRRGLIENNRAFVFLRGIDVKYVGNISDPKLWMEFSPEWENSGNTQTVNLALRFGCHLAHQPDTGYKPPFITADPSHIRGNAILGPKQTQVVQRNACGVSTSLMDDIKTGKLKVFLLGMATYRDVFGNSHKTESCVIVSNIYVNPKTQDIAAEYKFCRDHNCADDDCNSK